MQTLGSKFKFKIHWEAVCDVICFQSMYSYVYVQIISMIKLNKINNKINFVRFFKKNIWKRKIKFCALNSVHLIATKVGSQVWASTVVAFQSICSYVHGQIWKRYLSILIFYGLLISCKVLTKIKKTVPEIWPKPWKFDLLTLLHLQTRVFGILTYRLILKRGPGDKVEFFLTNLALSFSFCYVNQYHLFFNKI